MDLKTRSRTRSVCLLTLLLLLPAIPSAGADEADRPTGDDARLHSVEARLAAIPTPTEDGVRVGDLIDHALGLYEAAGLPVHPVRLPTSAHAAVAASDPHTVSIGLPGGDLDGDGRGDVLVFTIDLAEQTVVDLEALDADGATLWTRVVDPQDEGAPVLYGAVPDLDGDGGDDLLGVGLAYGDPESGSGCIYTVCNSTTTIDWTWTVSVLSGADGARLWSKSTDGGFATHYQTADVDTDGDVVTADTEAIRFTWRYDDLAPKVTVMPSDDGTMVLHTSSSFKHEATYLRSYHAAEGPWPAYASGHAFLYHRVFEESTEYASLDGATGTPLRQATAGPARGDTGATAIGDVDGDGTPDILVTGGTTGPWTYACGIAYVPVVGYGDCVTEEPVSTSELRVEDAVTGAVHWSLDPDTLCPETCWLEDTEVLDDRTGDGMRDVAVAYQFTGDGGHDHRLALIGGATGAVWLDVTRGPDHGDEALFVQDRTGDGLGEVLRITGDRWAGENETATLTLTLADGATDVVLANVTRTAEGRTFLHADLWGDLDGDGLADVAVEEHARDGNRTTTAYAGADLGLLWEHVGSATSDDFHWLDPVGDLDGDGGEDLIEYDLSWDEATNTTAWSYGLRDGTDLTESWTRTGDTGDAIVVPVVFENGDMDGDGIPDLLVDEITFSNTEFDETTEIEVSVQSVAGTTGAIRWHTGASPRPSVLA